jgi:hypothetical protein
MPDPVSRLLFPALVAVFAAAAPAQDPLVQQALGRIAQVERLEEALAAGDQQQASFCLNQLGWAGKRLQAVGKQDDPHWKAAKARYDALWRRIEAKAAAGQPAGQPAIDQAALAQLDKEVRNGFHNFGLLSRKHLADPFRVNSTRAEIQRLEARLGTFPEEHEGVRTVAQNLRIFRDRFEAALAQLAADEAASGDIGARLEQLRAKYQTDNQPGELSHPFAEAQLRAWAAEMRRFREVELPADLAFIDAARGNAATDQQQVSNLRHWLAGTWARRLGEIEQLVRERLASDVTEGLRAARFVLETKADDPAHVANRILGKGRFDEQMAWLRAGLHAVAMARVYDEAMGSPAVMGPTRADPAAPGPEAPDRAAEQAEIERAIVHMKELAVLALDGVRLPKPASTDEELLRIAAETLRRPDYEIAGWERLVINMDKQRRSRREAWATPGTVSVRIDYYEYVWDQYQVTTVERVGDQLWLFANLLKRFESGDPTTPIGRWILSQRFELTPILPEHVRD